MSKWKKSGYVKASYCENCSMTPLIRAVLQVDHIDGDKYNNDISNFRTLCANCHIIKTILQGDHKKKYNKKSTFFSGSDYFRH